MGATRTSGRSGPTTLLSVGALAHDFEDAHPGLDLGWEPVVGKGPAQTKEAEGDGNSKKGHLALVAAIDAICQPRIRTRPAKPRGRRAANANDAAMRLVPIAGIAAHNS